jgi:CBS domain-containing protein
MQVKDVMVREVFACAADDSLNRAAQLMWEHDCGVVPIIDSERRVVGMLTDRDICMAAYTQGRSLDAIRIRDAMSCDVISCGAEDPVAQLELMMRLRRVRRVPVVDSDNFLVGIVSLNDLARRAADRTAASPVLGLDEVGATLASVCQPWCAIDERGSGASAEQALPCVEVLPAVAPARKPAGPEPKSGPGPRSAKVSPSAR